MKKVFYNIGIFVFRLLLLPAILLAITWIFLTEKNPASISSAEEAWNKMKRDKLKNI